MIFQVHHMSVIMYLYFFDRLKNIPNNSAILEHFKKKILNDLVLFLLINLLFFYLFNKNYNFKKNLIFNNYTINKYYWSFFIFITLSSLAWFFKGALVRYGISYIYIFDSPLFVQ